MTAARRVGASLAVLGAALFLVVAQPASAQDVPEPDVDAGPPADSPAEKQEEPIDDKTLVTAEYSRDSEFANSALWLGVEISHWWGVSRDQLDLDFDEAYK